MAENVIEDQEQEDLLPDYKKDYSFDYKETNIFSSCLFVFCLIIFGGLFIILWGASYTWVEAQLYIFTAYISIPVIILGIFLHEIVHAVFILAFSDLKIKDLKAGISWINFTPYIHSKRAVSVSTYRVSTAAPALILGIIPVISGIITGHVPLTFFGIIFTVASGSDILSLWKLRKVDSKKLASDHPDRAGCFVFDDPFS